MVPNILIVDDSLTVRMDLADAFGPPGFNALPCGSLREARDILQQASVDAAILDVVLPDGDGIELLSELRQRPGPEMPVLMLSTEVEVRDRVRGLKRGANEYVGKPYDVGYLVAKVRQLLQARFTDSGRNLILLVDDSLTFRQVLAEALEGDGYEVLTAKSAEEGLRAAADRRPAAIIVDGVLPGMDGAAMIRRIRLDAALRGIPCILLTAASAVTEELRALDSGADAFVHKDEHPEIILAKLRALLRTAEQQQPDAETKSLLGPKKILTVDDSATYRDMVATELREEGYEVICARSGEEAIELLSVQSVDCVLLDLMMPGMDGKETCKILKNSPVIRDIPIVLLTAVDDRATMLEGLALGADDYIDKASPFEVLKARVRAQLRRRQFEDETRRVREQLLRAEIETTEARAARELAETRARLVEELESRNQALHAAYQELQATQSQLVQSAKMASLGELVAGVAHEINNPLAFVLSHVQTARSSLRTVEPFVERAPADVLEPWERARSRLSQIEVGLERIRDLVLKLRTFSRLDEGERKPASMSECVESVLTILNHRLKDRITVQTGFGEPDVIECYPSLLNQAIMNLVSNAIDASSAGGKLAITTGALADRYQIVVRDSGHGIPAEIRERVMEPFFTTKPVGEGTGLGLSITYSIIKKHAGTLELRDAEGGGTAAVVSLPLEPPRERAEDARA